MGAEGSEDVARKVENVEGDLRSLRKAGTEPKRKRRGNVGCVSESLKSRLSVREGPVQNIARLFETEPPSEPLKVRMGVWVW